MKTVQSRDGTRIAFERSGIGPSLILITGALSDHTAAAAFSPHLESHFTVYSYDRRGRGESGNTQPYAVEREVEDLAALVDDIGEPVFLFGHSSGAILTLEAALGGLPVWRLVLYEPPLLETSSVSINSRIWLVGCKSSSWHTIAKRLCACSYEKGEAFPTSCSTRCRRPHSGGAWLALAHTTPYDAETSICHLQPCCVDGPKEPKVVVFR